MFKLLRLVFVLTIGIYLGFQLSMLSMGSNCTESGGTWTGTFCIAPEGVSQ